MTCQFSAPAIETQAKYGKSRTAAIRENLPQNTINAAIDIQRMTSSIMAQSGRCSRKNKMLHKMLRKAFNANRLMTQSADRPFGAARHAVIPAIAVKEKTIVQIIPNAGPGGVQAGFARP